MATQGDPLVAIVAQYQVQKTVPFRPERSLSEREDLAGRDREDAIQSARSHPSSPYDHGTAVLLLKTRSFSSSPDQTPMVSLSG